MVKEAIILAGGLGTRLRKVIKYIPKPMADINSKPFLEYLLLYLEKQGIERVILAVAYKWEVIKKYFGGKYNDIEILYSIEDHPLGTGGAIRQAIDFAEGEDVFVFNGDTFFNIDLNKFFEFHKSKNSNLSLALRYVGNTDRYGIVKIDENFRIVAFLEKKLADEGLINAGNYLINKKFFLSFNLPRKFSFERDFLEKYYKTYSFYGFPFEAYFIDIGIPDDYERAKKDFRRFEY